MNNTIQFRIPTTEEWDHLMDITHENNNIAHWKDMSSWVHDEAYEQQHPSCRASRGYFSARYWLSPTASNRRVYLGFRPAFEGLNTDSLTTAENGTVVIGTLYMDGTPVRVPKNPVRRGDIEDYIPGATLTFGPALKDPAYQVTAIKVGSTYIADRVLLKNISYEDVEKAIPNNTPEALAKYIIQMFNPEEQPCILMEEMSELQKELLKRRRGKGNRTKIIEEFTHVQTSLLVVKSILGITDEEIQSEVKRKFDEYEEG